MMRIGEFSFFFFKKGKNVNNEKLSASAGCDFILAPISNSAPLPFSGGKFEKEKSLPAAPLV